MDDMGFYLWCLGVDMLSFLGFKGGLDQKEISEFWFRHIEFDGFERFGRIRQPCLQRACYTIKEQNST